MPLPVQDCLQPLSMQALPAQPESLCIVEMGGVEKQDELGEKGSMGFLYLNIGLQVPACCDGSTCCGGSLFIAVTCVSERGAAEDGSGPGDRRPLRHQNALPGLPTRQTLQSQDAGPGGCTSATFLHYSHGTVLGLGSGPEEKLALIRVPAFLPRRGTLGLDLC